MKSCGYNPLRSIRRKEDGKFREQDVLSLANTIMPTLDIREPFWERAAAGYLAFLIAFATETLDIENQNMSSVCNLHHTFIRKDGNLSFLSWAEENPDTKKKKKFFEIQSSGNADKMWSSII